MRYARLIAGRWLLCLGVLVLPRGRCRDEITEMLRAWSKGVHADVWLARIKERGDAAVVELFDHIDKNHKQALLSTLEKSA